MDILFKRYFPASYIKQIASGNTVSLDLIIGGNKITVKVNPLYDSHSGISRYYFSFINDNDEEIIFHEEITGHSFSLYHTDLDGDGNPELIITYHCGAHSMSGLIFKFDGKNFHLFPNGEIGSDFPEFFGTIKIMMENMKYTANKSTGKTENNILFKPIIYAAINICLKQKIQ